MAKMRVHELAKALDKSSREILDVLKQQGVEIQSHMSMVTEEQAERVKSRFRAPAKKAENTPAKKPAPVKQENKPARPDQTPERRREGGQVTKDGFRNFGREEDRKAGSPVKREERREGRDDNRARRETRPAGRREDNAGRRDGRPAGNREGNREGNRVLLRLPHRHRRRGLGNHARIRDHPSLQ